MSTATSPPPLPPAVLAHRYRLERRLAQGGMAEVWLGTDLSLTRQVAIKVLKPTLASDPVVAERFRREAIAVAQLSHPNIVAVYDAIEDNGRQAVVMQLVNGKSLRQLLDEQKRLSPDLTMHIGTCVAAALDAAHRAGMVHRDVKPGNILITPDGRVLLTDFGIAKGLEPSGDDLTSDNIMMGTAKYLSPEQVRGKRLDGRADLYSLGLVLYECLAGRVPFLGQTDADTALARLQRDPTDITRLRPTLPHGLAAVIHKLLARRPDDRYSSGAAVKAALDRRLGASSRSDRARPDRCDEKCRSHPRRPGDAAQRRVPQAGGQRGSHLRARRVPGDARRRRRRRVPAGADSWPTRRSSRARRPRPHAHRSQQQGPAAAEPRVRAPPQPVAARRRRPSPRRARRQHAAVEHARSRSSPDGRRDVDRDRRTVPAASVVGAEVARSGRSPARRRSHRSPRTTRTATWIENDADVDKSIDGNPATQWSTSCYSSEYFGGKGGVGVVVTLDAASRRAR